MATNPAPDATFSDPDGRRWAVWIQWGHPAPSELGIVAARFECVSEAAEPARVGFVLRGAVESAVESDLRVALSEADPARGIG